MTRAPGKKTLLLNGVEIDPSKHGPIDLAHLSGFTRGNRSLERRILEVFTSETGRELESLSATTSIDAWCKASHSLKNSACSVGAWHIAQAASAAEELTGGRNSPECMAALECLTAHVADACRWATEFIETGGNLTGNHDA